MEFFKHIQGGKINFNNNIQLGVYAGIGYASSPRKPLVFKEYETYALCIIVNGVGCSVDAVLSGTYISGEFKRRYGDLKITSTSPTHYIYVQKVYVQLLYQELKSTYGLLNVPPVQIKIPSIKI